MEKLNIDILTPLKLFSEEETTLALDLICDVNPDLTPDHYGRYETAHRRFDPAHRENILQEWGKWGEGIYWKRKHPPSEGWVNAAVDYPIRHASMSFLVDLPEAHVEGLVRFMTESSVRLQAHFAYIHLLTVPEIQRGGPENTISAVGPYMNQYLLTVTTNILVKYLPDLYWGTVFGPPYVALFGREHLLSSPAPIIRELDDGSIYLQLSESPMDLETNFARVDNVRFQTKTYIDHNAFYNASLPSRHKYNVPKFNLTPNPLLRFSGKTVQKPDHREETLLLDFDS